MPIWADVLLAIVLAIIFGLYFALVIERAKGRAVQATIAPSLERTERILVAIPTLFATPIDYSTQLLDADGNSVGHLSGMTIGHEVGEIVTFATRRYEVLEVRPETEGVSDGALVVKPL